MRLSSGAEGGGGGGGGGSYLLLYVGVGGSEQPVDLWGQISAHLRRPHAGQSAQSQRLHILVIVDEVAGKHGREARE